jgi:hypothetical protein
MATVKHAESTAAPKDTPSAAVPAVTAQAGLPAGLMDEMEGLEGAGTSGKAEDNVIPFLVILQDMSPQVKQRDPAYIKGAQPGCMINRATGQMWSPDKDTGLLVNADGEPLRVQPVIMQRSIVEWVPREAGGGMAGRHPHDKATIEESLRACGGVERPDPRDAKGQKKIWKLGNNDLTDTRYQYVNIVRPDGRVEPAVIGFASTGHQQARQWMALQRNMVVGGKVAPAWFADYGVKALQRKNASGEWFVLAFEDPQWIAAKPVRDAGRALYESVNSGELRAAAETDDGAGAGRDADLPI